MLRFRLILAGMAASVALATVGVSSAADRTNLPATAEPTLNYTVSWLGNTFTTKQMGKNERGGNVCRK